MAAARAIQVVKPHIAMIKFPIRGPPISPNSVSLAAPNQAVSSATKPSSAPPSKPIGFTPRGSGIEYKDLPARYRRRPIPQEEIDYIIRGGPE